MTQVGKRRIWNYHSPNFESDFLNENLATSPWSGHRNFAFDLVSFLEPLVIVELGTHYGCSFFSFLQASKDLNVRCETYAIDTWVGDKHAGFYDNSVYDLVQETIQRYFPNQDARLLRKRFDEALSDFDEESVDLLHIDGLHTYEAARNDFETWLPKLKENGVVLFHDVMPSTGYGSAKYWSEIKAQFPHFEFLHHSWGLGVLFPKGDFWYREIGCAKSDGWLELYRYKAERDLFLAQRDSAESMARARWDIMQDHDKTIAARDKTIVDRDKAIAARDSMVAFVEKRRAENTDVSRADQEVIQRRLDAVISAKGAPFSDLAFSLYVFIERLFLRACQNQTRDIYFLSREGWDLKEMFELYHQTMAPGVPITAHYLEASRRSSFLPSLGPLEAETFEVLFRQYRAMSLEAFLSSLGLDARSAEISAAMGLGEAGLGQKRADLPTDPVFRQLLDLPLFQTIYETERQSRSAALEHYVARFTGGVLPNELVLVDVGWKGSIQDNLYRWFQAKKGPAAAIHGYYIGLNVFWQPEQNNQKTGLLFNTWPDPSRGFRIFNENRSLFEILLPARHGGPWSYEMGPNGTVQVRHEPYMEQELIDTHVQPIAAEILAKFKSILNHQVEAPLPDQSLLNLACRRHARMVFEPTHAEIEWVCAIHHRENFGAFEESRLGASMSQSSILERVRFTARIIRYRRFGEAGFWPYLTLKQRAVPGLSTVYRTLRKWQESGT